MHYIVAPTHIRATHYAAALGLSRDGWSTLPSKVSGLVNTQATFHLLPGVSDEAAARARFCASKTEGQVIDHG